MMVVLSTFFGFIGTRRRRRAQGLYDERWGSYLRASTRCKAVGKYTAFI